MQNTWVILGQAVLTGVIASFLFFLGLCLVKPRIKVSEKICLSAETPEEQPPVIVIKIVNRSKSMLVNLHYCLQRCSFTAEGNADVFEIEPLKPRLHQIARYSKKNENKEYAIQISYPYNKEKYFGNNDCKLIFTVFAEHSYSNTIACLKRTYTEQDVLRGVFETGLSTDIVTVSRKQIPPKVAQENTLS